MKLELDHILDEAFQTAGIIKVSGVRSWSNRIVSQKKKGKPVKRYAQCEYHLKLLVPI